MRLEAEANHSSEKERMREPRGADMRSGVEGLVFGYSCLYVEVKRHKGRELLVGTYLYTET